MKNLLKIFVIALVSVYVSSCSKDDDNIAPESGEELSISLKSKLTKYSQIESENDWDTNLVSVLMGGQDCFTINYPVTYTNGQNSEVTTVNNDLEFIEFAFSFGNQSAALQIQYPITVTLEDETQMTVDSQQDIDTLVDTCAAAAAECNNCEANCFTLVYPIDLIKKNGVITKINNAEEGIAFLEGLEEDELITLSYPVNIVSKGEQMTVNNDEELNDLFIKCITD